MRRAQVLSAAVLVIAGLGVIEQWWLAITDGVGPAPALAPGALAEISLAILLATVAHPALRPTD